MLEFYSVIKAYIDKYHYKQSKVDDNVFGKQITAHDIIIIHLFLEHVVFEYHVITKEEELVSARHTLSYNSTEYLNNNGEEFIQSIILDIINATYKKIINDNIE